MVSRCPLLVVYYEATFTMYRSAQIVLLSLLLSTHIKLLLEVGTSVLA